MIAMSDENGAIYFDLHSVLAVGGEVFVRGVAIEGIRASFGEIRVKEKCKWRHVHVGEMFECRTFVGGKVDGYFSGVFQ